jgi:hypothetical protein
MRSMKQSLSWDTDSRIEELNLSTIYLLKATFNIVFQK